MIDYPSLACCDEKFRKAVFKHLSQIENVLEDITHLHKINKYQLYFNGATLSIEITAYPQNECLFLIHPVSRSGEVIRTCCIGSGWMNFNNIEDELERVKR